MPTILRSGRELRALGGGQCQREPRLGSQWTLSCRPLNGSAGMTGTFQTRLGSTDTIAWIRGAGTHRAPPGPARLGNRSVPCIPTVLTWKHAQLKWASGRSCLNSSLPLPGCKPLAPGKHCSFPQSLARSPITNAPTHNHVSTQTHSHLLCTYKAPPGTDPKCDSCTKHSQGPPLGPNLCFLTQLRSACGSSV